MISPDCQARKCPCTGDGGYDDATETVVPCTHPCHDPWTAVFDNALGTRMSPEAIESLFGQRVTVFATPRWDLPPLGTAEVTAVLPPPPDSRSEDVALTLRWVSGDRDAMAAVPNPEHRVGLGYEALTLGRVDGVGMVTEVALLAVFPASGTPAAQR